MGKTRRGEKWPVIIPCLILLFPLFWKTAAAEEETWFEAGSPNFVVISNASMEQAQKAAKALEQFRILVKQIFPAFIVDTAEPLTVFAVKDEKSFLALRGDEEWGKGEVHLAGVFMGDQERKLVAARLDTPGDSGYRAIYHEYAHMLMRMNIGKMPRWLDEGLAEFFSTALISDGESTLGNPEPVWLKILKTGRLIPLEDFFGIGSDYLRYRGKDDASIFYAQSWALTHYMMVGGRRVHIRQLDDYLESFRQGASGPEAARQTLGGLKELEKALRKYVGSKAFQGIRVQVKPDVEEDGYEARALSRAESLAARGELLFYFGKPEEAKLILRQCLQEQPRHLLANEVMGRLYLMADDYEQADEFFSIAVKQGSKSFPALFLSAQAKLSRGGDEDMPLAETLLRKAIAVNPRFGPAYSRLAYVLQRLDRLPEAFQMTEQAERLEPETFVYGVNAVTLLMRMGKTDEALSKAQMVLETARTDESRRQAESLLAQIQNIKDTKAHTVDDNPARDWLAPLSWRREWTEPADKHSYEIDEINGFIN